MELLSTMALSAASGYPLVPQRRRWTQDEDRYLTDQVRYYLQSGTSVDWRKVSQGLANRSNKDCRKRWLKIDTKWNQGQWSKAEDDRLRRGVDLYRTKWKSVSDIVETRNPDQCAKRWRNALDPNLERGEWSREDDDNLVLAVSELGRNWKEIVKERFPGRSRLDLSNRYTMLNRKKRPNHRKTLSGISKRSMSRSPAEDSSSSASHDSPTPEHGEDLLGSSENLVWNGPFSQPAFHPINPAMHSILPSQIPTSNNPLQHRAYHEPTIKVEEWNTASTGMTQESAQASIHAGHHTNSVYSSPYLAWQSEWPENKVQSPDPAQGYNATYTHSTHHSPFSMDNDHTISQCESPRIKDEGSPGRRTITLDNVDESTRAAILDALCKGKKRVSLVID